MSDQLILNIHQFLAWSFICVVCGSFFGAAVYAFICHWFESRGYKAQDHEENQAEMDELFGTGTVVEAGTLRVL